MTDHDDLLTAARRSARRAEAALSDLLAVELSGRPVYVVLASECPPGTFHPEMLGAANPQMASALARHIPDRWAGDGVAVFVDDLGIVDLSSTRQDVAALVTGIAVHEAAHVVEFVDEGCSMEFTDDRSDVRSLLRTFKRLPADPAGIEPPWGIHNSRFVRLALHIAYRLKNRAHNCPWSCVFDSSVYGLETEPGQFAESLDREFEDQQGKSLLEVLKQNPPEEYVSIWFNEVMQFHKVTLPERRKKIMLEFLERLRTKTVKNETDAAGAFKKLALRVADGRETAGREDQAAEILKNAGKTVDDLAALVALIVERRRLADIVKGAVDAPGRRAAIDQKWKDSETALQAAEQLHEEICGPLRYEVAQIEHQEKAAREAGEKLVKTATDMGLKAAVDAAQARYSEKKTRLQTLVTFLNGHLHQNLMHAEAVIDRQYNGAQSVDGRPRSVNEDDWNMLQGLRARKAETEAEIADIRAELPDLEKAIADAQAALLDPSAV